jgi:hypothetical protein
MVSQGLLFSEPSVAETGVWCVITNGIDPAQWALICRYIGTRKHEEFQRIRDFILQESKFRRKPNPHSQHFSEAPLVSIGPSGIGGQFQQEHF